MRGVAFSAALVAACMPGVLGRVHDDGEIQIVNVRYGIIFDAGSSGTRIHTYSWKEGGYGPRSHFDLIEDDLLKIKPGLSAYRDSPSEAGASLVPLIEHAKRRVPERLIARTPVFLMATAGLRMVGDAPKDAILQSVCGTLSESGFLFRCAWADLLDGRDEGLFGWVTVNYLLDLLYAPPPAEPVGTIDLGGGSVQIVFPTTQKIWPRGYSQQLDFNGRKHHLYVKSHLGFGLDAARSKVFERLVSRHEVRAAARTTAGQRGALPLSRALMRRTLWTLRSETPRAAAKPRRRQAPVLAKGRERRPPGPPIRRRRQLDPVPAATGRALRKK